MAMCFHKSFMIFLDLHLLIVFLEVIAFNMTNNNPIGFQ